MPNSYRVIKDLLCDDCDKQIVSEEDELAYFNTSRCAQCEAAMYASMRAYDEGKEIPF